MCKCLSTPKSIHLLSVSWTCDTHHTQENGDCVRSQMPGVGALLCCGSVGVEWGPLSWHPRLLSGSLLTKHAYCSSYRSSLSAATEGARGWRKEAVLRQTPRRLLGLSNQKSLTMDLSQILLFLGIWKPHSWQYKALVLHASSSP